MKAGYYVKIDPSGCVVAGEFREEKENTLEWLQGQVGGYIECIPVPHRPGFEMILNEEGKLRGLQANDKATKLADCRPLDVIVGPVVIVKTKREEFDGMTFEESLELMDAVAAV